MRLITERVWCCVCKGAGKLPMLLFWRKPCAVCEGTGERAIMLDADFPETIKQQIRADAMFNANTLAALKGPSFGNSLSFALFGNGW